jgi:hypothetical protein
MWREWPVHLSLISPATDHIVLKPKGSQAP